MLGPRYKYNKAMTAQFPRNNSHCKQSKHILKQTKTEIKIPKLMGLAKVLSGKLFPNNKSLHEETSKI